MNNKTNNGVNCLYSRKCKLAFELSYMSENQRIHSLYTNPNITVNMHPCMCCHLVAQQKNVKK